MADVEHPGVVLRKYFMEPRRLSAGVLAQKLMMSRATVWRVASVRSGISTDMALRLARYFGEPVDFWVGLQTEYEISVLEPAIRGELDMIVPYDGWVERVRAS